MGYVRQEGKSSRSHDQCLNERLLERATTHGQIVELAVGLQKANFRTRGSANNGIYTVGHWKAGGMIVKIYDQVGLTWLPIPSLWLKQIDVHDRSTGYLDRTLGANLGP
jgi:hypothetical protein